MFMNKANGIVNEVYYKRCDKMLKLQLNTNEDIFNKACIICTDNKLFKGEALENVINNLSNIIEDDQIDEDLSPTISNDENTRGYNYFNNTIIEHGTRNLQHP